MTQEEKAKAYDEALERAKQIKNGEGNWRYSDLIEIIPALEEVFPELRESEDERIRQELLDFVKSFWADHKEKLPQASRWVDYLEKQKELTPADGWDYADKRMSHPLYLEGFEAGRAVERELSEFEKQKEQKPISSCDIVPYIDDKIAALQDMWREEKVAFDWDDMHEMIEDVASHFYNLGLNARKEENK